MRAKALRPYEFLRLPRLGTVIARALDFCTEAAEKIQALPEVSRALTRTGTRRAADKQRLEELPQE
jgi:hypothetical protein